jgi:hypothetical protein
MLANQLAYDVAKANITRLFNVKILLGFHCFMPLFKLFHGLPKMAQDWDIYVVDFVEVVKLV